MSEERLVFFNSLPQLYRALKKERQKQKILGSVRNFLKNSFNEDLQEKVDRFLKIPGIGFIPTDMEYFKLYSTKESNHAISSSFAGKYLSTMYVNPYRLNASCSAFFLMLKNFLTSLCHSSPL